ncbi:MAG: sulfite exporter TauE/SafE family protein [Bacteroidetes bacterium]|nr:sulfite exporter TauE/SafE family protein [Bacteroidota bacterium]
MNTWINQVLSSDHANITVLIAVFLMGMVSVVTCGCNFAVIGVVAGYSGASSSSRKTGTVFLRGFSFLVGAVISMAVIGSLFGYAGKFVSDSLGNYWKIAAGLIAIFFGLYSMDLVPFKLPALSIKPGRSQQNIFSAIIFGLAVGGLSTALNSCCNPIFPVILAASFVKGSAVWGLMMLSAFGLGYGMPLAGMMVGLSLGVGKISRTMTVIGTIAKYGGGIALVVLGFYFLLTI